MRSRTSSLPMSLLVPVKNEVALVHFIDCRQKLFEHLERLRFIKCRRMKSHQSGASTKDNAKLCFNFFAGHEVHARKSVEHRCTEVEDARRFFAHSHDSSRVLIGCCEVQIRELGDCVTQRVIHGTEG